MNQRDSIAARTTPARTVTHLRIIRERRDRGFTLVEVVIAIVLVGILSAVVVVGVGQLTTRGTTAACTTSADAARAAATTHFGTTGTYPTTFTQMTTASPPALTLPSGASIDGTGQVATVGTWTLALHPGSAGTAPVFLCSTDLPTGYTMGPNGHLYRLVTTNLNWNAAAAAAATVSHSGLTGYLATITSSSEQAFVQSLLTAGGSAWIGGSDAASDGAWRWSDGPEAGQQFATGSTPFNGAYTNWNSGQPDGGTAQNCIQIWADQGFRWDDLWCTSSIPYIVELGR